MTIAFSIDFERLSHARAYRELEQEPDIELRLSEITNRLLDILNRTNSQVTFFIIAEIAESEPEIVRRIYDAGHEIASHTHSHRILSTIGTAELEDEIIGSKSTLESVIDDRVDGFRAPELNLDMDAVRTIEAAGYEYDSSAIDSIPIPGFYSTWADLESDNPQTLDYEFGTMTEVPVSVHPQLRIPVSGAWIRLLGRRYTFWTVRSLQRHGHVPVLYVHPRAFQHIPKSTGLPRRIHHHTGDWMFDLVESLLSEFDSVPVTDLVPEPLTHSR